MITDITQANLVAGLTATIGQTPAQIATAVQALLALNTTQTASFTAYINAVTSAQWSDAISAINTLSVIDYPNMLPAVANQTPLDVLTFLLGISYFTGNQEADLQAFLFSINPINILVQSTILTPITQTDFVRRLKGLFPPGWASTDALSPGGNLYNLLSVLAMLHSTVSTLLKATQESFYLTTALGSTLDVVIGDYFGSNLPRNPNETDDQYRVRAYNLLFTTTVTRPGFQKYMNALAPTRLVEPWAPADTGVWDGMYYDVDTAVTPGTYTDASLRYQGFAQVSISNKSAVPLSPYTVWVDGTSPTYTYNNNLNFYYPIQATLISEAAVNAYVLAGKALGTQVWVKLV
jgi:hypothetical protein